MHKTYWTRNWAIKEVASLQTVMEIDDQMWLWNPVSRFWYSLRFEKDIFSTLVQGTASYVFDLWITLARFKGMKMIANFHDELVTEVDDNDEQAKISMEKLLKDALQEANDGLKLNRELKIDVQFGYRYSTIH